jgi:hypothetical protein
LENHNVVPMLAIPFKISLINESIGLRLAENSPVDAKEAGTRCKYCKSTLN